MDEAGTVGAECNRKVTNERMVAGAIRYLVNARDLKIEWARILYETLLVPVLTYGSDTMFGMKRRALELGLCRWTTSVACLVLEVWIEFRMHG